MDAFQGSYKTETRDLRYFSAFYLLLRLLMLLQVHIFPSYLMLFTSSMLFFLSAAVVAIFQPYKVKIHNAIDSVLMILMGIFFVSYYCNTYIEFTTASKETNFFQVLPVALLLFYFISLLVWKQAGVKLQAAAVKAKVMWVSIVHRTSEEEGVESFDREVETRDTKSSYPPLLGTNLLTFPMHLGTCFVMVANVTLTGNSVCLCMHSLYWTFE